MVRLGFCFILILITGFLYGQPCYNGLVTADSYNVCAAGGVDLTCAIDGGGDNAKLAVLDWEYSTFPDNPGSWISMGVTGKTINIPSLGSTLSYRAKVRYDVCATLTTPYITIQVSAASLSGTLQGNADVCEAGNNGTLTISGQRGNVEQWYKRTAADVNWVSIANTNTFLNYVDVPATTRYRAAVRNGVCASVFTNEAEISVFANPVPAFTASHTCHGNVTAFTNQTTIAQGYITEYLWDFGDGSRSSENHPAKEYAVADAYSISLTAVSNINCSTTVTQPVLVHPIPVARFRADDRCLGDATHFLSTSKVHSTESMHYRWDFGDGQSSTDDSPLHTYTAAGAYPAKITAVTDNGSCRDSLLQNVIVDALPLGTAPDTSLLGSAEVCGSGAGGMLTIVGQTGVIAQWYKRDANDADWVPLSYSGHLMSYKNLTLSTRYRVEVRNGVCPADFTNEALIAVYPAPKPDFDASLSCDGAITRFTNYTTIAQGDITGYLWDFGDGSHAAAEHPVKQYHNPDTYQVSLTAVSDKGCSYIAAKPFVVHPNPISAFNAEDQCFGYPIHFINSSWVRSDEGISYFWDFGDGQKSNLPSPDHLYDAASAYRVSVLAITADGLCRDSVAKDVISFAPPPVYAGRDTAISAGLGTQLHASGGLQYFWDPFDGLSSAMIADPFANPQQTTLYTLSATDERGCINTSQVTVTVVHDFSLIPYNVITPDGNGENDVWAVEYIDRYPQAQVRIINRWGEEVYASKNYSNANGWKGTNKNGDMLPEGTYYYIITTDRNPKVYKGAITLFRK
jgi:gliding motility-associated-like protein